MQVSTTVFDVAVAGRVIESCPDRKTADAVRAEHPGAQIRTRSETKLVPAKFGVFVDGEQVGEPTTDPGEAARRAKQLGGMIKMVAAS